MSASMSTSLRATVVAFTLAAPGAPALADSDPAAIVEGFYDGLNGGGPAAFERALADDWIVHGTSPSLPTLDFDAYLEALSGFSAGLTDSVYTIEAVHAADDVVTVRGTITGTHSGPLFGVPATGTRVEFGAIDVHRVEDDTIAESWHVEDFATLLGQIGASGAAGSADGDPSGLPPAEVERLVRDYFAATQSGDATVWAATFADDAVVEDPVGTPPLTTPEAIRAQGEGFVAAFESIGLYESFVHVNGNEAVAMWQGRGTTADGAEVTFDGIDLFEFDDDGKITLLRGFWTPPGS